MRGRVTSTACPMRRSSFSPNGRPMSCTPTGNVASADAPLSGGGASPQGRLSAGRPAKLTFTVIRSPRNMSSAPSPELVDVCDVAVSKSLSPKRNAVLGATGDSSASQVDRASNISVRMSARTRCAYV